MARPKIRGIQNDLSSISEIDWARIAAYIDGEGHIAINQNTQKSRVYVYLRVVVTNTDPRLVIWLQRLCGGGVLKSKRLRPHWRPAFKWTVTCRHAAAVLEHCLPYFITKRDQAELALAFQNTIKGYYRWKPLPVDVVAIREQFRKQLLDLRSAPHADIVRDEHGNAVSYAE